MSRMKIGRAGRWSGVLCGRQAARSWLSGIRVIVDHRLPPDVIEVHGAPGSVVRITGVGTR